MVFDSDLSGPDVNNSMPIFECSVACDSNAILKVRPDRECGQWLSCASKVSNVSPENQQDDYCLNLAACKSMREDGTCARFLLDENL